MGFKFVLASAVAVRRLDRHRELNELSQHAVRSRVRPWYIMQQMEFTAFIVASGYCFYVYTSIHNLRCTKCVPCSTS